MMKEFLKHIQSGQHLSEEQMTRAMNIIMDGKANESQIAAFLMGLSVQGENVEEITGAAKVMRSKAQTIKAPYGAVDCCGTGGDKSGTYNISTAVAIVAASCGIPMAKHGNRAASSKSGAADVLEALGVNLNLTTDKLEEALNKLNFAFLMAPNHHAAMKHVVPVRKELGVRTIFNLLGPLANPAGANRQLIGVFDPKWLRPMAEALCNLGTERAWLVHGSDGLDEITTSASTTIVTLDEGGNIEEGILTPEDFGIEQSNLNELLGGNSKENADALLAVLKGKKGAYRDIVLANTAAVLCIHSGESNLKSAVKRAENSIDNGLALQTLDNYIKFSQEALKK